MLYTLFILKNKGAIKMKTDRIQKAIELIEAGKIWKDKDGTFRVFTDRINNAYTVTPSNCDCADFEQRQVTGDFSPSPCKHQWAAIGATAAMLIGDIRKADSLNRLQAIGKTYADAMRTLPDVFVNVARKEYKARQCELVSQSREDEEIAILIKPQPRSNGSYNGIEI
jgi:hypothetical protein